MQILRKFAAVAILSSLTITPSLAQAAQPCLSKDEVGVVVISMLPAAAKKLQATCEQYLPADAALNSINTSKIAVYEAAAKVARPTASAVIKKTMAAELPDALPGSAMMPFIEAIMVEAITEKLEAKDCTKVNNLWPAIAPLKPSELGGLVAAFLYIGQEDGKQAEAEAAANGEKVEKSKSISPMGDFNVCPYIARLKSVR